MQHYADVLSDPLRHMYGGWHPENDVRSTPDLSWLKARCTQIGDQLGWRLDLAVWDEVGFLALTARAPGTDEIPVSGPDPMNDDTLRSISSMLDALQCGARRLVVDAQGDPRLI